MTHPHQSMLDELSFAIKHFVPTLPEEIKQEAEQRLLELSQNPEANVPMIHRAFYEIGKKEYPHRHAYDELTHTSAEAQMKQMVIEHVDETVRSMIKPHLDAGVGLDDLVHSDVFEKQLDPKQRYQVEDGILVAKSKLAESLKKEVGTQSEEYSKLVEKWQAHVAEIEKQIANLEALAQGGTENQQEEIKGKVVRFREGFLVTEPDPDLEEIKKEIEYWTDTFAEEE